MRCDFCSSNGARAYRFISDGMLKEIHVCDRCVRGLVNEGTGLSHEGLRLLIAHASLVQDSDLSEISVDTAAGLDLIFSVAPIVVLKALFGNNEVEQRELHEAAKRRIYILENRLRKALRQENYKIANVIKRQIAEIRARIMET
ncbi:MAG: hypothetical protein DRP33_07275 [Thermotogae bacterium]|nr:MAG: hypothetical protein DRP33_07275 [Thermotogota bacterium]